MTRQIILASGNPGKLREFKQMLEPAGYIVSPQSEYHVNEADEPYFSFVENALNKARHVSGLTGKPALADDSGLCADALGGSPGVLSARYAGELSRIVETLKEFPGVKVDIREAHCRSGSLYEQGSQFLLCSGLCAFG